MKKKLFLIAALVVAAAAVVWYALRADQGDGIAYLTEPVITGGLVKTVNATGEVGAVQLVSVGAQVGGQIKKLHVVLGQDVKKGDLIAEIDSVPQLNQLETDKAKLESYTSQLAAKKVALKIAKTKYDRELQLKKRDASSKESLEDAENAYALAKAEVTELESLIRQSRIAVNTDEVNLGYTRITAPLDGTIVSVPVDEGQTVNANQTTPTIVQIADLDKMELKIEISEGDITAVKPGMPIRYTILSDPETVYDATLTSIDPGLTTLTDGSYKTTSSTGSSASSSASSSSNNAVYYYGKALIDNKGGPLRIGMTTQTMITVANAENALLAPVVAVTARDGKKYVRVLNAAGQPEEREVTTGLSDGIHIQILSGLKAGDDVITAQLTQKERDAELKQRHRGPRL
ncbi:efflux RND transporter periplasmic adaptor subunit [uncultured Bilophila sp.]|uniref:efflux RND transporter periplasmic adaptor subunit n=1 Tax=uncultured Bilophila sp. TaxID=529385 RepID=UPI0026DB6934|nr:efflux RND transporter periplasmic adaptor subunit [uncultured Bilophila sp.]